VKAFPGSRGAVPHSSNSTPSGESPSWSQSVVGEVRAARTGRPPLRCSDAAAPANTSTVRAATADVKIAIAELPRGRGISEGFSPESRNPRWEASLGRHVPPAPSPYGCQHPYTAAKKRYAVHSPRGAPRVPQLLRTAPKCPGFRRPRRDCRPTVLRAVEPNLGFRAGRLVNRGSAVRVRSPALSETPALAWVSCCRGRVLNR